MNNDPENSIRDQIIESITAGKVTMKPRWYFVLHASLLVVGIMLVIMAVLYLVSFIIFILHQSGAWFVTSFGIDGIKEFLVSFPWLIVLVAIIFISLLEALIRKFSFGYQRPLIYTAVGVLVVVTAGGFVVAQTPLHRALFDSARGEHLPFAGGIYKQYGIPHRDNVAIGSITSVNDDSGYIILDRRDMTFEIMISENTEFPDGNDLQIGESIAVFGSHMDYDTIQAIGIRRVTGRYEQ